MDTHHLYSIVFISLLCSFGALQVHAQSSTSAATTGQSTAESTTQSAVSTETTGDGTTNGTDESTTAPASTSSAVTVTKAPTQSSQGTPTDSSTDTGTGTPSTENVTGVPDNNTSVTPGGVSTEATSTGTTVGGDTATPSNTSDSTPDQGVTGSSTQPTDASSASVDVTTGGSGTASTAPDTTQSTPPPTAPPTAPPTTQAPLSTKYPTVEANTERATYTLSLAFTGTDDSPETSCNDSHLLQELDNKLESTHGYMAINNAGAKKLNVLYRAKDMVGKSSNETVTEIQTALDKPSDCYNNTNTMFATTIGEFAKLTGDYCSADYICPIGYKCQMLNNQPVCTSLCEASSCQNNGVCTVVVANGSAKTECRCAETYESIFHGDNCELDRMNPERVAAIVGGVLGAVCFILLVALYCMCYRRRDHKGKKYHLSGVYNETYDHASLDMKNM